MVDMDDPSACCALRAPATPARASCCLARRDGVGDACVQKRLAATGLYAVLEARDAQTAKHSDAVARLVWQTARAMNLNAGAAAYAAHVAMMHDIGKVAIPDAILLKQGPLSEQEWQIMRRHSQLGEQIVASVPALADLAPAVRAEHERWDGNGYPDGLSGEAIPLASRLVLACDAYEAMVSDRPYRAAMAPEVALGELRAHAGSQFDPAVVAGLVSVLLGSRAGAVAASSIGSSSAVRVPPAQRPTSPLAREGKPALQPTTVGRAVVKRDVADEHLAITGAAALDVLYVRHQAMVLRYCRGLLRNPETAADAAQSTWLQAMVALSAPDTVIRNVRTWLRAIARNVCLDALRPATAVRIHDVSMLELPAATTTEEAYENREQLQSLLVDLQALSDRQRSAIVLRELCGLSPTELADEFQTTPQRASGLVADARRTLTQRKAARLRDWGEHRHHDPSALDHGNRV